MKTVKVKNMYPVVLWNFIKQNKIYMTHNVNDAAWHVAGDNAYWFSG